MCGPIYPPSREQHVLKISKNKSNTRRHQHQLSTIQAQWFHSRGVVRQDLIARLIKICADIEDDDSARNRLEPNILHAERFLESRKWRRTRNHNTTSAKPSDSQGRANNKAHRELRIFPPCFRRGSLSTEGVCGKTTWINSCHVNDAWSACKHRVNLSAAADWSCDQSSINVYLYELNNTRVESRPVT